MGLLKRISDQEEKKEREAAEARGERYYSNDDPNRPAESGWRQRAKEGRLPTWSRGVSPNASDYGRDETSAPL